MIFVELAAATGTIRRWEGFPAEKDMPRGVRLTHSASMDSPITFDRLTVDQMRYTPPEKFRVCKEMAGRSAAKC